MLLLQIFKKVFKKIKNRKKRVKDYFKRKKSKRLRIFKGRERLVIYFHRDNKE